MSHIVQLQTVYIRSLDSCSICDGREDADAEGVCIALNYLCWSAEYTLIHEVKAVTSFQEELA